MDALATHAPEIPRSADQRVFLNGVSWEELTAFLRLRGDVPGPRLTYFEGTLELMSPSFDHEYIKKNLARLIEGWAFQQGIRINGAGSWTLANEQGRSAVEPDECYTIGRGKKDRPDLAIEVIWTSGGMNKLAAYRALGVREVWIWERGEISVYALEVGGYQRTVRSQLLPALNLARLAAHATISDQHDALTSFLAGG